MVSDFSNWASILLLFSLAINGHSKKQTPLVSGWFYFPLRNSGRTLTKNFLKSGQVLSGHCLMDTLYKLVFLFIIIIIIIYFYFNVFIVDVLLFCFVILVYLAFFFSPISEHYKLFRNFTHCSSFFTVSNFSLFFFFLLFLFLFFFVFF